MNDDVIRLIKEYAGITSLDIADAYRELYPNFIDCNGSNISLRQIYFLIEMIKFWVKPKRGWLITSGLKHEIQNYTGHGYVDKFMLAIAFHVSGYKIEKNNYSGWQVMNVKEISRTQLLRHFHKALTKKYGKLKLKTYQILHWHSTALYPWNKHDRVRSEICEWKHNFRGKRMYYIPAHNEYPAIFA